MKALFERIFGRRQVAAPVSTTPGEAEQIALLRDHIRRDVAIGFHDEDVILGNAADAFADEIDALTLRREAQQALRQALAEHFEAAQHWPEMTDCDRLDAAFAALEEEGIIARHNFSCCGTCGSSEIWDEVEAAAAAGGPAHGYAFYHMQDSESAAEGDGLYLNYGACDDGEAAALAVGRDVIAELESHGLSTQWDGNWGQRIRVELDWKRRR